MAFYQSHLDRFVNRLLYVLQFIHYKLSHSILQSVIQMKRTCWNCLQKIIQNILRYYLCVKKAINVKHGSVWFKINELATQNSSDVGEMVQYLF